jgi:excisionase family DNA binding protein
MENEIPTDLIRPSQAAKLLNLDIGTIYRWINSGKLPAWKRGGSHYVVSRADVAACLEPVRKQPRLRPKPKTLKVPEWAQRTLREAGIG